MKLGVSNIQHIPDLPLIKEKHYIISFSLLVIAKIKISKKEL